MVSFLLTLKRLLTGIWHAFKEKDFQVLFVLTLLILFSGTIFYHEVEGLSWLDSLYFCVATLSTVGHPDFAPQTEFGKIFTIFYIIAGTGLFLGLILYVAFGILTSKNKPSRLRRGAKQE
ncbi:potassium channel family protein [Paenibacillus lutrae]|uniref:Two pore domain potassium channel family protein n=1 Tax=Paenibacillus lutrae TaxID=2078573 RepID=A0A7X3FHP2_9BACL|nr:potassium channel family protein [Paenibacillus lutrae]MVO99847.1 two pore domain potassium channel family protein [Paenibacillus lutrae]